MEMKNEHLIVSDFGNFLVDSGSSVTVVDIRKSKAGVAYAILRHLWCQTNMLLKLQGRVYLTTACSVFRVWLGDVEFASRKRSLLGCFWSSILRSIARIERRERVRIAQVKNLILGTG